MQIGSVVWEEFDHIHTYIHTYTRNLANVAFSIRVTLNIKPASQVLINISKTRWLYCVKCPQYSIRLEELSYLCTSCLLPAFDVTWFNSRWWLAACDWVMSALSAMLSTRLGRRRKFKEVSCTECKVQVNNFELIPTVEMEIRNPIVRETGEILFFFVG